MKKQTNTRAFTLTTLRADALRSINAGGQGCWYADVYYSDGSKLKHQDGEVYMCKNGQWTNVF